MNDPITRRKLFREARNLGFRQAYRVHSSRNIAGLTEFICHRGTRFLRMHICDNGNHSISHGTTNGRYRASETTMPTEFKTVHEMWRAIAFEWQRPSRKPNEPLE